LKSILVAIIVFTLGQVYALQSLSENLGCEVIFFEAHFNYPPGYDKSRDQWLMSEKMHQVFTKAPLASYAYYKKIAVFNWHLTLLKPIRHHFEFLDRYELSYLEARLTSLGQTLYRFEHKINHRKSVEFSLDALDPQGVFIQHAITHDQFLHLTCAPE
jgi:hypothetical protein